MAILNQKKDTLSTRKKKSLIFYSLFIAFPLLQFIIFYVFVNFNSLLFVFESYNIDTGKYYFTGLNNFKKIIYDFSTDPSFYIALVNSFIVLFFTLIISVPCGLIFSFYIYKKMLFSGFFRVILFLPSILSAVVLTLTFRYFVDVFIPSFLNQIFEIEIIGFLADARFRFSTLVFYSVFIGFGTTTLLYTSAMSGISESIVEASHVDGVNWFQEFYYITLPMVYSTFSIFIVTIVATLFANQIHLFIFYFSNAEYSVRTIGYFLYIKTLSALNADYPYLATFGVLCSFVAVPITFLIRKLLRKLGPTVE